VLEGAGCARLFGWDIHAPGLLSENFFAGVRPSTQKIALYIPEGSKTFESKDRGGQTADPQTYHIGEAFEPMLIEAFQHGFEGFVSMEAEPTPEIMARYEIPYLAVVRIKFFKNDVTWKGQRLEIVTEIDVMDADLRVIDRYQARGISEAQKVFAKRGGPETNLNAAIESNVRAIVEHLQDVLKINHPRSEIKDAR
jgi:hypothetical protein